MSNAHNVVLAMLTGQASATKLNDAPAPQEFLRVLPEKGTLTAADFLLAMRDAGKRTFQVLNNQTNTSHPVIKVDETKVRGDRIAAIAAYVGWNPKDNFGPQELRAIAQANREVHGKDNGPTYRDLHKVSRTLSGYVHGMPDTKAKRLDNLLAQEKIAAGDLARLLHEASKLPEGEGRAVKLALAEVEETRLAHIRQSMADIV
jgi:hypothetical protein